MQSVVRVRHIIYPRRAAYNLYSPIQLELFITMPTLFIRPRGINAQNRRLVLSVRGSVDSAPAAVIGGKLSDRAAQRSETFPDLHRFRVS